MITGDFNADVCRGNRFDNLFSDFVSQNQFLLLDRHLSNDGHFSYKKGIYTAFIDHCILSYVNKICDWQCNVLYDDINTSDHNAVKTQIYFQGSEQSISTESFEPISVFTINPNMKDAAT